MVKLLTGRFMQYFRENAKCLERTYAFVPRIGIEHLREVVVEDSLGVGTDLDARMQASIDDYTDPWQEGAAPATPERRAFGVNGQQVAMFRLRSGAVHAVSAVCPHRGGPLADGQIDGSVVLCPLHLNAFELSTGCSTTGQTPLQTWHVEVDDGGEILLHPH